MKKKIYVLTFLSLTILYWGLSFGLPTNPEVLARYQITATRLQLITLSMAVPLTLVWLAALYGFLRFKSYTHTVINSVEGRSFGQLSAGLMVLAYSLPLLSSVSTLAAYESFMHPKLLPTFTILKNYLNLLLPFIAMLFIAKGASGLLKTNKKHKPVIRGNWDVLRTIFLSSIYIWLITTRPTGMQGDTAYFLPNWLVILTLAIPYLFIWCKGFNAVSDLFAYKSSVSGNVYKQAIGSLTKGIGVIIVLSIYVQFITTVLARVTRLQLSPVLLIVYVLVFLYAMGYGWVALGAKKLKQIEEV